MNVLTAPLVSPTVAASHYGVLTTHTNSLANVPGFGPGYAPEIVETARALKNDPDLIYEFVHNQIEVEFAFGVRKGPLGALINKSGTPFDQNVLFVDLVRQAGYTAQYQIGQVTIAEADFANWTGVSDIQAACRLLAAGGIPATFNGQSSWSSDCSQTGAFTSVTILHVWSQVEIGGVWYAYDPSFKSHTVSPGINIMSTSGMVSGQAAAQAATTISTGTASGSNYVVNASESALNTYLAARGAQALSDLKANEPSWDTDGVVGITKPIPAYKPTGGWRNATPPGYTVSAGAITISGDIPDQYRCTLAVTIQAHVNQTGPFTQILNYNFFVDDIDGRRLGTLSNFLQGQFTNPSQTTQPLTISLMLDDVAVRTYTCTPMPGPSNYPCPLGMEGFITLTATHPYAATVNGEPYGFQSITKGITAVAAPLAIVSGWGFISPALSAKWSRERTEDNALPMQGSPPYTCGPGEVCWDGSSPSAGDFTNEKLAASWLAQTSRMMQIQAQLGGSKADQQHSIGIVGGHGQLLGFLYPPSPNPAGKWYYGIVDQFSALDIDSAVSVTSMSNDFTRRNAVARSIALAAATLEGSVVQQAQDIPDTASTATRFAWGNQPDNEDPCFTPTVVPRRFYDFTGSTSTSRASLYLYEGAAPANWPAGVCRTTPPTPDPSSTWVSGLDSAIGSYLAAGYNVTASAESFLGPGARFGPPLDSANNQASLQRGGAIVATQYDTSGNVLSVAHVLEGATGFFGSMAIDKGGAGAEPTRFNQYDPSKAADILKDRFVDRSVALGVDLKSGTVGYTTPSLLSVGGKSVPYGLEASLTFKAGFTGCLKFKPCTGPVQGGWNHNWDVRFSNTGSGEEALGDTSPQAAAGTLVAFLAMQDIFYESDRSNLQKDIFATLTADWWRQQMVANVATVNRGFGAEQFTRLVDNTWLPPIGAPGTLTQTGTRVMTRDPCGTGVGTADRHSTARRWDFSGVTFSLRHGGGDVMNFAPSSLEDPANPGLTCAFVYFYEPTNWTFPQGPTLTFTYDPQDGVTGVATSLGRSMTFTGENLTGVLTASTGGLTAGQQTSGGVVTGIADAIPTEVYKFDYTAPLVRSATQRPVPFPLLVHVYEPVSSSLPALEYDYDTRGLVEQAKDAVALQVGGRNPYSWFIAEGGRGERDDPAGGAYTVYYSTDGDPVRNIDELSREVDSVFDGRHRVTSRTFPEGDQELFGYDTRDNVVSLTQVPKPCPNPPGGCVAPPNIVVSASYDPTWDKIASVVDALGHETDFTYFASGSGASMLQQAQRPAVGGVRPTYAFQYSAIGLMTRSVDAAGYTTTHGYDSFGNLTSTTEGAAAVGSNPALNLTTTYSPDAVGNVVAVTDPRGNAVTTAFDNMRRKTDEYGRNGGTTAVPLDVSHFVYDLNGRLTTEQNASALDSSGNPTAWATTSTVYTPTGKVAKATDPVGDVTQTSYDPDDRTLCVDVRMNPSTYSSLPSDACQATAPPGSYGPDRITKTIYDLAGQTTTTIHAFGDSLLQQNYASYTYGLDGEQLSVTDSLVNTTGYTYDAFNRLIQTTFPSTVQGSGQTDPTNFEAYSYDANGNRLTLRKRDGAILSWCYDVLNRETDKYLHTVSGCPAPTGTDVATSYDLAGRTVSALFASGQGVSYGYDAAGRLTSESTNGKALAFQYDAASNRTRITWPDSFYAAYAYDPLNRVTSIVDSAGTSVAPSFTYDPLSRRLTLARGNGTSSAYGYDLDGRLTSLSHTFPSQAADNQTWTFTYNPAGQDLNDAYTNAAYLWTNRGSSATKTYDGLNRDAAIAAIGGPAQCGAGAGGPFGYDCNGNLTDSGTATYAYDLENRLISATSVATGTSLDALSYDPLGRLNQTVTPSLTTSFLYEGDNLVAEYSGATLKARYIPGPGVDEPLAWYDYSSGSQVIRWLHADRQGSIVAQSITAGTVPAIYAYGPYGEPQAWVLGGSRFAYTGQIQLPEIGLYHYKARAYDPSTGRFLQTDPVGYKDDVNLYAYVHEDPVDHSDPTGLDTDVELRYYVIGNAPIQGDFGHQYVYMRDTKTGETVISRAGPSEPYPQGSMGVNATVDARQPSASGHGNVTIVTTMTPASQSIDTAESAAHGGARVVSGSQVTLKEDIGAAKGQLQKFNNAVDAANIPYQPRSDNSNAYAGTAYGVVTGRQAPSRQVLPGSDVNLKPQIPACTSDPKTCGGR